MMLTRWTLPVVVLGIYCCAVANSCGKDVNSDRGTHHSPSILVDDRNVLDATGLAVASKGELDAAMVNSMALADASLGRMFDFDDGIFLTPENKSSEISGKFVFCDGEVIVTDIAQIEGRNLKLTYEADVSSCATKPAFTKSFSSTALTADDLIVDRQISAFTLTFSCSSRDLSKLGKDGKASTVMATSAAFSCPAHGQVKPQTGRAYRFVGRVEGRYVGPRSEVPIEQRFWRGYDDGSSTGGPCLISRGAGSNSEANAEVNSNLELKGDVLGACLLFERSESVNLVDNSRKGHLLTATTSPRSKNGSLFDNGNLSIQMNGWSAATRFSPQDTNITMNFNGPGGACAAYILRPAGVNFEAKACQ